MTLHFCYGGERLHAGRDYSLAFMFNYNFRERLVATWLVQQVDICHGYVKPKPGDYAE